MKIAAKVITWIALGAVMISVSGCSFKSPQNTKPSVPTIGIIDVETVIKNHPKNALLEQKNREYNTLAAEFEAIHGQSVGTPAGVMPPALDGGASLNEAAGQEFNAKMTAKENEIRTQLDAVAAKVQQDLSAEIDAYVQELDKDYQPQIFSLQLKQKTLQLTKEQAETIQADIDRLQKERGGKIKARQQELAKKMDEIMAEKQAEAKRQLNSYGQTLHTDIGSKLASRQAELANQAIIPPADGAFDEKEQQLAMKKQEIAVLQETIINDIKDKAAKLAAEKGLEIIFANVQTNISAVDITNAVIEEIKKQSG